MEISAIQPAPAVVARATPGERFDLNRVQLSGKVRRTWSSGNDVFVRLAIAEPAGQKDSAARVTLLLKGGMVSGLPVTLMDGDELTVSGYLVETPYTETGRAFAERSRKPALLTDLPGLASVTLQRMATCIVVEQLAPGAAQETNSVILEGLVASVWEHGSQLYARLAIYDEHTQTEAGDRPGKNGRPRRKAHYVSICLPNGQVDGRKVRLEKKNRLRVHGRLSEQRYSESLALFLLRAGQIGLLADAANADDVREIRTPRTAAYVVARSLIQFTN